MIGSVGDRVVRLALSDALARCDSERWDGLVAATPSASPFMRWAWHNAWLQSAPPDTARESFVVMLCGPGESVRGMLPLAMREIRFRRRPATALTWAIGGLGSPDHLDFPATPDADVRESVPLLETLPWDVIVLSGVAHDAMHVAQLTDAFARRGYVVRRTVLDSCPYVDLPGSWDEYLASLSANRRQIIRRNERRMSQQYKMVVTDYAPDRLDEGWRHLRSLHEERWAGPGALGAPHLRGLLRAFSADLAARGQLWLTTLDLDGVPAAAWCGFALSDTVYFYQSGRDPKWAAHSVGAVLLGAMIRRAIERGYRRFDLLRGQDAYKLSWTSTARPIYEIVVFHNHWRATWLRGLDLAGRLRARLRSRSEYACSDC